MSDQPSVPEADSPDGELSLQPVPTSWKVFSGFVDGPAGPIKTVAIVFNVPNTIFGTVFAVEDAKTLAAAIMQEAGGLHIAGSMPNGG